MTLSRKKRKRSLSSVPKEPRRSWARRHAFWLGLGLLAVTTIATANYLPGFISNQRSSTAAVPGTPKPIAATVQKTFTLDHLLTMVPDQLAEVDIAEMNLLCATGLPGAENLDIAECMARLDQWAVKVRYETERHLYRAHDPKWADHYKHSENWLRAEFLAQVLQEDCGVHYNMDLVRDIDFTKSKDLFIHGMIDDGNGGTCSSMPVLYVAVGRRLGYPLKLVTTKAHIFVRWDDGKESFNIETTSNGGTSSYSDDYYRSWPETWTDAEAKANRYLVSLTPPEELAQFLGNRGHCLLDNGRAKEAFDTYAAARKLAPRDPAYSSWVRQAEARLRSPVYAADRPPRRGPGTYQHDPWVEIGRINAINRANMQRMAPQLPAMPSTYQSYQPPVTGQPPE